MIPNNITKEHLNKAIKEIDKKGISKGRHSSTYDLIYEGKNYPPKLVVSISNKFVNGKELNPSDFNGGKGTTAFKLLENNGFTIVEKEKSKNINVIAEFISKADIGEVEIAQSIKLLIAGTSFKKNLKVIDDIFFSSKLHGVNSENYLDIINFTKEIHKIKSGKYNDFNIWSASKTHLKKGNKDLIVRHDELNKFVGFPDNGNGLYKSFLGANNLLSFIKKKFDYPSNNLFYDTKNKFGNSVVKNYIKLLRKIISELNLKPNDQRVVYSVRENRLNFTIGQRYCFNLYLNNPRGIYGIISKDKLLDNSEPFGGSPPQPFYNYQTEFTPQTEEWNSIMKATKDELNKTSRSGFRKHNNSDFENYVFEIKSLQNTNEPNMNFPLNTILYGPPGTGKTYNTILRSAQIIENCEINSYSEALKIFKANLHNRIEFITFHQNYSYEDFIQGLRPDTENDNQLTFERKDGVFKEIADKALKNLTESENPKLTKKSFEEVFNQFINPLEEDEIEEIEVKMKRVSFFITAISNKSIDFRKGSGGTGHTLSIGTLKKMYLAESVLEIQGLASYYTPLLTELLKLGKDSSGKKEQIKRQDYVIIIDEINRANISRVFGELITLIEPDKRSHGAIPLEARLPSGDPFIVPSNLFIIGTMNTADKSIALLDIALRRRFEFESMYPKYEIENQEIYDVEILKKINKQIIKSKGHDFQIGHAYFMGDNKDLVQRMNKKVIPLLLEYYMNDEKEVKGILNSAGLIIEDNSWPLKISGKNG